MAKNERVDCDLAALRQQIEEMKLDIEIIESTVDVSSVLLSDASPTIPIFAKPSLDTARDKLRSVVSAMTKTVKAVKLEAMEGSGG